MNAIGILLPKLPKPVQTAPESRGADTGVRSSVALPQGSGTLIGCAFLRIAMRAVPTIKALKCLDLPRSAVAVDDGVTGGGLWRVGS